MRIRLGLLREFLHEAVMMSRGTTPSAPTDDDATVPGHLPNELSKSAALDEQGWVPGRFFPNGFEPEPVDRERTGDPAGLPSGAEAGDMDETDDRMLGDGKGNGIPDPDDGDDLKMSPHLKGDDEKTSLGDPPEEKPEALFGETVTLNREIKQYLLQEYPAGAGMVDPVEPPKGFYSDFDAEKDHGSPEQIQGMYYLTPARPAGTEGDPFRPEDPSAALKMHCDSNEPTTVHPAVMGMDGVAARRAPEIGALTGGGDTSTMLGANAKPGGEEVDSEDDESEEGEEGADGESAGEGDQAESEEQG